MLLGLLNFALSGFLQLCSYRNMTFCWGIAFWDVDSRLTISLTIRADMGWVVKSIPNAGVSYEVG